MVATGRVFDAQDEGIASFQEKRQARFADRVADGLPEILPGYEPPTFT